VFHQIVTNRFHCARQSRAAESRSVRFASRARSRLDRSQPTLKIRVHLTRSFLAIRDRLGPNIEFREPAIQFVAFTVDLAAHLLEAFGLVGEFQRVTVHL
jgi:hypothetical protein